MQLSAILSGRKPSLSWDWDLSRNTTAKLYGLLMAILLIRLALLAVYPLLDTSEARYAEMARKMVELNDWVTPMFDYEVPFWGKPPLSFWAQALSIKIFGPNEFAVRLPSLLYLLACCSLLIRWGREEHSLELGLLAAIVLASSSLGFVAFGAVLTDPALCFSLLLAVYGFWRVIHYSDQFWAYMGFVGLAFGMLAKGPIALVLFGAPAFFWLLLHRQWYALFNIPWLGGLALFFILSAPWYVIAEWKTPGFWDYFFIGEHWRRFLVPGWAGDLYGNAHLHPRAYIWIYAFAATLPWCLLPVFKRRSRWKSLIKEPLFQYSGIIVVCLLVFFSFSRNILWTYVLPVLPLLALMLAWMLLKINSSFRTILFSSLLLPALVIIMCIEGSKFDSWKNQKQVIQYWSEHKVGGEPLFAYKRRIYSAEFYSGGLASRLPENLDGLAGTRFYLIVRESYQLEGPDLKPACVLKQKITGSELYYCQL
ncbi:ArnT family glycosyltransferase [Pseudoteredinibacter isoporae]|uniref:4-amino-4-deoxy-L-arabinose transferase-like glycosyltransferase n=1 Tax=Pseudoteredinibacter isoporae TaxID=570281 RepID=A0A7X0JPU0_9GAMM|nr:glycosyltransferase family 39 protein [Pseudoteredinibacter isoporae]MBB6520074.1 4-amino-4-deoxy-L-arabinose transferase-like glycosyltransferase [Pseudoteredinibacter isoporae]NHO85646.1 glycosyltransferase family 39 protein [Pseudoteredinibacter isoporae]NIB25902.1 glycosyltransferase family 39 protein [Pseudoteredinibacter isoporae]